MRLRTLALSLGLLLVPSVALANGRFPAANQLVVQPGDPTKLLLRTTFGLVFSSDQGATWDWLCENAVGYGGTEDPSMAMTVDGTIVAGTYEGLATSHDRGCGWAFATDTAAPNVSDAGSADAATEATDAGVRALTKSFVIDVVERPDTPSTVFLITNKFAYADDAGDSFFSSDVWVTADNAKTWSVVGPSLDPAVLFYTIEVAASDPQRLYTSGIKGDGPNLQAVFLASADRGLSWTETMIPIDPLHEHSAYIAAVDPNKPGRVYVRTKTGTSSGDAGSGIGSRLLVTDDGGQTFREVLKFTGDMLGFALSADGSKVWAGGPFDGLYEASTTDLTFTKKSTLAVQCLTSNGALLYACSSEVDGFILGASHDDGTTFSPTLHIYGVRGPLACSGTSSAAQCVPLWPAIQDTLGTPPSDGGTAEGGANEDTGGGTGKGCSCDSAPTGGEAAVGAGLFGLAAVLVAGRRKRRSRR